MRTRSMGVVVLAHAGHWAVSLAIYVGPFVALALWLTLSQWRERRRRARQGETAPPAPPPEATER
jgi:hypothetical protein